MLADAGFPTIRAAIESGIDITGEIRGFEVAYAGVTIGTYPMAMLRISFIGKDGARMFVPVPIPCKTRSQRAGMLFSHCCFDI